MRRVLHRLLRFDGNVPGWRFGHHLRNGRLDVPGLYDVGADVQRRRLYERLVGKFVRGFLGFDVRRRVRSRFVHQQVLRCRDALLQCPRNVRVQVRCYSNLSVIGRSLSSSLPREHKKTVSSYSEPASEAAGQADVATKHVADIVSQQLTPPLAAGEQLFWQSWSDEHAETHVPPPLPPLDPVLLPPVLPPLAPLVPPLLPPPALLPIVASWVGLPLLAPGE
jgi:hypothetical protein